MLARRGCPVCVEQESPGATMNRFEIRRRSVWQPQSLNQILMLRFKLSTVSQAFKTCGQRMEVDRVPKRQIFESFRHSLADGIPVCLDSTRLKGSRFQVL